MSRFEEYCARQRTRYGDQFIPPADPDDWLVRCFNNGPTFRVKVRTTYASGETRDRWGYVSLTTGWRPSFMLMARRGQHGSSDLIGATETLIESRWIK